MKHKPPYTVQQMFDIIAARAIDNAKEYNVTLKVPTYGQS